MSARIIEVIETQRSIGEGVSDNPHRIVYEYWTKDGELMWSRDTWEGAPSNASLAELQQKYDEVARISHEWRNKAERYKAQLDKIIPPESVNVS